MAVVSELIVSIGAEGTQAVLSALKQVDGAQVQLSNSTKNLGGTTQAQTQKEHAPLFIKIGTNMISTT